MPWVDLAADYHLASMYDIVQPVLCLAAELRLAHVSSTCWSRGLAATVCIGVSYDDFQDVSPWQTDVRALLETSALRPHL